MDPSLPSKALFQILAPTLIGALFIICILSSRAQGFPNDSVDVLILGKLVAVKEIAEGGEVSLHSIITVGQIIDPTGEDCFGSGARDWPKPRRSVSIAFDNKDVNPKVIATIKFLKGTEGSTIFPLND